MKHLIKFIQLTSLILFSLVYGINPPQIGQFPAGFWEQMERQDIGQAYGDSGWVKKMTDWKNNPVRDAQLEFNIPVLLGRYSGATTYFAAQDFQNSLFDNNSTGSMSEYFTEISYGNFTVDGTAGGWYQSSYTMSEANSNTKLYVAEIAQLADPDFDYSQFDNDGPDNVPNSGDDDGYVDGIAVVYSGCGAEWGEGNDNLWPHMSSLGTSYQYTTNDASANGGYIIVNSYFVAPELAGGGDCYTDIIRPMGVYAHEFGHILGLPDLYDRDADNGSSEGIGNWCLMAGGSWNGWAGDTPAHMSAWCKQEMGWVDPTVLDMDQSGVDIPQTETNAFALKIWEDDYFWSRYFLVENRQQTGFDAGLPSNGLMIYHVDENRRWGSNLWSSGPVNDDHTHKLVDVEAADGNEDMDNGVNRGDGGDPFPGSASNTDFSSNSNPNSNRYSGETTDIVVTSISSSSSTMTADINLETRKGIPVVYDSTGVSGWGWGYSDPADSWGGVLFEYPTTELENGYLTEVDIGFRTSDNSYTLYVYDSFNGSTPGNLMFETSGSFSTSGWVSVQVDSVLVEPGQEFFAAYMLEDKSYAISFDRVTAPVNRSFFSGDGVTYSGTLGESYNINLRAKISNQNGTQDIYEPDISVSPDSFSEELYVGDSSTQVLTIYNNGDADLEWEIVAGSNSSDDNNFYSGCVDEYSDIDCGWALVAFEDAGYTQNLLYLGVDSGMVDLDNSGNIGHQLGNYSGEVLIVAGDYYYKFSSDSNIFVNLHSPFIDLYDFVSNDDQLSDWVEQDGGIQFCRGAQYPNIRPGDTSWGLIPNGSAQRGCGCNSGGWSGYGAYYGGFESGCTSCSCQGGGWSGTRANGEHKGAGAYLNVDLEIYIRNVSWLTTSVNSGILSPGDNIDLDVIFNADGLNVGDYQANIVITSNDPDEPSIDIPVHLDVDMLLPDISVSPDSLSEELYVGDSSTQVLTISNNGDADLDWEISFSAQQRVLGDFILPPGFIGNLDLSDNSTTSTATIILKDRPLSTHNNSSLNRDTMYDVLVYNSSAGVSTVINEHPEINATQVYSYVPEDLQDYQVLFNIRQDDIYSEETLEWIYNGGTWVGEWHSNDYPISSWGAIEGTATGDGASGSQSVNILDPDHWIAQNIDWDNIPVGSNPCDYMRNITIDDPDANIIITVNHSFYGEVPLIVEKSYGNGTIVLFNWDYQDGPSSVSEMIRQVAYYACTAGSVPWLSFADGSGTIAAGSSQEIEIEFNAAELDTGLYNTEFFVLSNDPDEPSIDIPVHLDVDMLFPDIAVSPDSLSEELYVGDSSIQSLTIYNNGEADLNWAGYVSFTDSARVMVRSPVFGPGTPFNDRKIENERMIRPLNPVYPAREDIYAFDPIEYVDAASPAANSRTDRNNQSLEDILSNLNENYASVNSIIPNRYDFTDGVTGYYIYDGGHDMYDNGNKLGTDLGVYIDYSDNEIASSSYLGEGGQYFTRKYDGLFVFAGDINGLDYFEITGNNGLDGGGSADGSVLEVNLYGRTFYGFVKRVVGGYDPSINHLIIVEANDGITHEFDTNTDNDYHRVTGLGETTQMYYLLYAGRYDNNGYYIDDDATLSIMEAFLNSIDLRPPWLNLSSGSGTITMGESAILDVAFNASDIAVGTHYAQIEIVSNDEDEPQLNIPVSLTANIPYPDISVTPDSLNEHLFYGDSSVKTLTITNEGVADLNWNLNILDYGRDGTSYTFTNCGNEGFIGPSQQDCDDEYVETLLEGIVTVADGIQEWIVPQTGLYGIEVWGAQGGSTGSYTGGLGTRMRCEFVLDEGDIVHLMIGQEGTDGYNYNGAGGGGATAVMINNDLFVVSGGGGGAGTGEAGENGNDGNPATSGLEGNIANGNISANGTPGINGNGGTGGTWYAGSGGAGWLTNGSDATGGGSGSQGGTSLSTSGMGGQGSDYSSGTGGDGGFGGGAGAKLGGGGGGGYSGGAGAAHGGSWNADGGGGGGSYNAGENQDNEAGVHSGNGIVVITLDSPSISWVSASENSGTVPVGESHTVNMSFNSSELEEGDYLADIKINSNDPDEPEVDIPVTLSIFTDVLMTDVADTSVYEDSGLALALSANYPGYEYTFTASSDTSGVEASVGNDTLILSPEPDWTGTASIQLVLNLENSLSDTIGFTLTVHAVNDPPNAYDEVYYMDEDDSLVTVLPADDGDSLSGAEDDQGLTFIAITGLQYGSYDLGRTDGQLTYAPNPDYFGPDSLLYVLTDDGTTAGQSDPLSDTALIVIHTLPINDSPVLESLSDTTMYEDSTLAIVVTATDIDNDDLSLEASSSNDEYITVEIVDTVLYINSHFNWFGSATITVLANDNMGRAVDVEEFQLTVLPVNDAPYFDNLFALEGVGIEFELHLFAYDIDGDTLSMNLDSDWTYPDWLALDYDPFRLTGTAPEPGEFHFPLHLSDGQVTFTDTFHLSVHYFHPRIMAITDVPDDQGGRVYIDFNRSFFDNPDETNQFYTVFRYDAMDDSSGWVGVGTGSANGNETYRFEVFTLVDSTGEQDGMTEFKVVAFMNEGTYQSEPGMGYSLDNLAPDAPGGLTADIVDEGIYLSWDISIEDDFQHFNLEKSLTYEFDEYESFIITDTSYMDPDYVLNETQYYRLTAVDLSGNVSDYSDIVEAAVLALDEDLIPDVYALHQNYPNPFNPVTNIRYDLPEDAHVMIRIFDIQGRMVKTLVSGQEKAGRKSIVWNATNQIGEQVAAGMYLYLIQSGEFQKTRKMVLLK